MDLYDFSNYSIVAINGKAADPSSCDETCLKYFNNFNVVIRLFKTNHYGPFTTMPLSSLHKFVIIEPDIPKRPATYMHIDFLHDPSDKWINFAEKSRQCETNLEQAKLYKCTITLDTEKMKSFNLIETNLTSTNS